MAFFKKSIIFLTVLIMMVLNNIPVEASTSIDDVRSVVNQYYVEPVSSNVINEPTIDGILSHLDKYSVYFTADGFRSFMNSINNNYVGIGVGLATTDGKIMISLVFSGSTAEESGVQVGDQIISVNDTSVENMQVDDIVKKVSGLEGTTVKFQFYRAKTHEYITKILTRKKVTIPTVMAIGLAGNVEYMAVNSFNESTVPQMQEQMKLHQDVEHWIIDIRNNGGGYVSVAQQVVGMFPKAPVTLIEETRNDSEVLNSIKQPIQFNDKIDLLTNQYSASASEILAGALKDTDSAESYGETTYGKGVMQNIFSLSNGDYLKLTIAEFFTPLHHTIQNVGITPNIETDTPLVDAHLNWFNQKYKEFKQLPILDNIPTDKIFTIKLSAPIDLNSFTNNRVELIQLGGESVPISLSQLGDYTIKVKSDQPLIKGGQYLLLIHNGWKSKNGKVNSRGTMVRANVQG